MSPARKPRPKPREVPDPPEDVDPALGCYGPPDAATRHLRCGRKVHAKGLCQSHFKHFGRYGRMEPIVAKPQHGLLWTSRQAGDEVERLAQEAGAAPEVFIADVVERALGLRKKK